MWTLDEALVLIREKQPYAWEKGYHIVVGGSVINHGSSDKDLDLYLIPLANSLPENWRIVVFDLFGAYQNLSDSKYQEDRFRAKLKIDYDGKRIDCFIM